MAAASLLHLLTAVLAAASHLAAPDPVEARGLPDVPVSAYGGWVVWDGTDRRGRDVIRARHRGRPVALGLAHEDSALPVDVGPDDEGRAVVTLVRCPSTSPCVVEQHRLDGPAGAVQVLPVPLAPGARLQLASRWRSHLAVVVERGAREELRLVDLRRQTSRALPGGARALGPVGPVLDAGADPPLDEVDQLDLGEHVVVLAGAAVQHAGVGAGTQPEVRLVDVAGGGGVVVGSGFQSGACGQADARSANAFGHRAVLAFESWDCEHDEQTGVELADGATRVQQRARGTIVRQVARDASTGELHLLVQPTHRRLDTDPCPPAHPCRLVRRTRLGPLPDAVQP